MNSLIYQCDNIDIEFSYGTNQTNLTDLVDMFNSTPPVGANATFLDYGICYDNGDGRVRMEMYREVYDSFNCNGELGLKVIYD
jgi:hypothetical protein